MRLPAPLAMLMVRGRVPVLPYMYKPDTALRDRSASCMYRLEQLCLQSTGEDVYVNGVEETDDMDSPALAMPDIIDEVADATKHPDSDAWKDVAWVWDGQLASQFAADLASWSPDILQRHDADTQASLTFQMERYMSWILHLAESIDMKFKQRCEAETGHKGCLPYVSLVRALI